MRGPRRRTEFEAAPPLLDEWRETILPGGARFLTDPRVDDMGNEPDAAPRHSRALRTTAKLVHRIPPLAVVWACIAFATYLLSLHYYGAGADILTLTGFTSLAIASLLTSAVLIERRNAGPSSRLVLLGAVMWTLAPTAAGLAMLMVFHLGLDLGELAVVLLSRIVVVVDTAALFGPLLLVIGLERTRTKGRARWPRAMIAIVLLVAALEAWREVAVLVDSTSGYGLDRIDWWSWVTRQALTPFSTVFVLAIAWSARSAVSEGETRRRFWRLVFLGSGAIASSAIASWILLVGLPALLSQNDVTSDQGALVYVPISLAGWLMLLAAFVVPVFESARTPVEPPPEAEPEPEFGPA